MPYAHKPAGVLTRLVQHEAFAGVLMMLAAALALILANSGLSASYYALLDTKFTVAFGDAGLSKPLILWINDGLMAIFFLLVGLEIKREFVEGELAERRQAALPAVAALDSEEDGEGGEEPEAETFLWGYREGAGAAKPAGQVAKGSGGAEALSVEEVISRVLALLPADGSALSGAKASEWGR